MRYPPHVKPTPAISPSLMCLTFSAVRRSIDPAVTIKDVSASKFSRCQIEFLHIRIFRTRKGDDIEIFEKISGREIRIVKRLLVK